VPDATKQPRPRRLDRGSIELRETFLLLGSFVLIAIALWNGLPAGLHSTISTRTGCPSSRLAGRVEGTADL